MEDFTDCPQCLPDCELTTYSTTITSAEFRWRIIPPILFLKSIFQALWLKKPEPEPVLRLESLLPGEMATCHQLDLWKHNNWLHQWTARAQETGVSNREAAKHWTSVISYKGYVHVSFNEKNQLKRTLQDNNIILFRVLQLTTLMKKTLPWWIFTLETQLFSVVVNHVFFSRSFSKKSTCVLLLLSRIL